MKNKNIIYALLFLVGLYLCMVCFTAISDFRWNYDPYPNGYSEPKVEMSPWISSGSMLLMLGSMFGVFGCIFGLGYNVFQYLKLRNIIN